MNHLWNSILILFFVLGAVTSRASTLLVSGNSDLFTLGNSSALETPGHSEGPSGRQSVQMNKFEDPDAHLKITEVNVSPAQKTVPFKGLLTLHGVTKPVTGSIDVPPSGGTTKGDAKMHFKASDHKIPIPQYLGITVADSAEASVHFEARKSNGGA